MTFSQWLHFLSSQVLLGKYSCILRILLTVGIYEYLFNPVFLYLSIKRSQRYQLFTLFGIEPRIRSGKVFIKHSVITIDVGNVIFAFDILVKR